MLCRIWSASPRISTETSTRVRRMYQEVEIMVQDFQDLYCSFLIPAAKLILMALTVYCTYGAIKMKGFLGIFLALIGLLVIVILVVILSSMALAHTFSEEILFLMKSPGFQRSMGSYEKKVVEALGVLKIRMSSAYYVDKENVITTLQILVKLTSDLLMANQ
jgi:hypothetical protein